MTPALKVHHPAFKCLENATFLYCFYEGFLEGHNCPKPAVTQEMYLSMVSLIHQGCIAPTGFNVFNGIHSSLDLGALSHIPNKQHYLASSCKMTGISGFPTWHQRAGEEPWLAGSEALLSRGTIFAAVCTALPVVPASVPVV